MNHKDFAENQTKNKLFTFRMSEDEYKRLDESAKSFGVSMSVLMRRIVRDHIEAQGNKLEIVDNWEPKIDVKCPRAEEEPETKQSTLEQEDADAGPTIDSADPPGVE